MNKVTFQINIAPGDYYHAIHLLEHHITLFKNQVDEFLLTFDFNPSRLRDLSKAEKEAALTYSLIENLQKKYDNIVLNKVDYSPDSVNAVTKYFFKNRSYLYDFRGAPIYAYLYGFYSAKNNMVFHIDSDMFFGGLSETWVSEALDLLEKDRSIMTVSPLPGPPHPNGILTGQSDYLKYNNMSYAFRFSSMSTRIFLMDRELIAHNLVSYRPELKNRVFAFYEGFPQNETLERIISKHMQQSNKYRVDFLGSSKGLYHLHPLYRSESFYSSIPETLQKLKKNEIPEDQFGYYNFTDSFIDWGDAKKIYNRNRFRNKLIKSIFGRNVTHIQEK